MREGGRVQQRWLEGEAQVCKLSVARGVHESVRCPRGQEAGSKEVDFWRALGEIDVRNACDLGSTPGMRVCFCPPPQQH